MLFALFILACGSFACAGEVVGAVGTNLNLQLASNGRTYQTTAPLSVRAGYRFSFADILAEYSYIHSSTGADVVSISQSNQEFLFWIRKGDPTAHKFIPFIAAGAGAHYQIVETRFNNQTDRIPGTLEAMAALAAGVELRIYRGLALTLEARATAAEGYAPNPLLGLGSYLNFEF
jgi:hypothetical protein